MNFFYDDTYDLDQNRVAYKEKKLQLLVAFKGTQEHMGFFAELKL